jgi:epsilon-lactone hydrolase
MMLLTTEKPERQNADAEILHPLIAEDGAVMAAMRAQVEPFKGTMTGPDAREAYDGIMEQTPDAPGVSYERDAVGGVRGIWCRPRTAAPGVVILYLHGGAYVLGSAHAYRHLAGQVAARANAVAFAADYRLAPEDRFPAALDDARAAYRGLVEAGARTIAIVGDSAGGGLTLAMLSITREEAFAGTGVGPRAAVALSPWTDLTLTGPSMVERAGDDPILTPAMLATTGASYLQGHDPRDPHASPLYGRLAGLPPIQLHVGTSEVLLDDSRRYVERARREGVEATVHIWEGMPHVFPANVGTLDAAERALDTIGAFLQEHLGSHAEEIERSQYHRAPQ